MRRLSWSERMTRMLMAREAAFTEQWISGECSIALQGVEYVWRSTKVADYFNYLRRKVDALIDNGDCCKRHIGSARSLLFLYRHTKEERYRSAAARACAKLLPPSPALPDRVGQEPGFIADNGTDAFCKAAPFFAMYAALFDEPDLLEPIIRSLLIAHGYDGERNGRREEAKPLSGMFLMAIVDMLDFLPARHPDRQRLLAILQSQLRQLARLQLPTGLWQEPPGERRSRRGEADADSVTASCLFVYALFKAARKGHVPRTLGVYARHGYEGILAEWIAPERNDRPGYPAEQPDTPAAKEVDDAPLADLNGIGAFILASVEADFISELTGPIR